MKEKDQDAQKANRTNWQSNTNSVEGIRMQGFGGGM
jgi:hypothetical protein